MSSITTYARRKWWFLLLVAVLLGLNVWVWRLALPLPASPVPGARTPMWLACVVLVVCITGMGYVFWVGIPMALREFDREHDEPRKRPWHDGP